jgi:hypothetical protein
MVKSEKINKTTAVRGLESEFTPSVNGIEKENFSSTNQTGTKVLYDAVKKSPELMSCLLAIVEDIMADSWRFNGGRSNIAKAHKF